MEPKSRTFEVREDHQELASAKVVWMIEEFDHDGSDPTAVARRSTPLVTIYRHEHTDQDALANGILSMLNNFGLPDGTRRFVELRNEDDTPYATDSMTGR